ncbi:hypothetical protein M8C21_009489 [Ambrosia artemisiifolia]|uniref:Uncharacterized protein n=1 Tax=Ambrosia artemisiifolia TaxID=4212 RepID=A0AAD5BRW6_AMBAR|nr:hypothetical protein M8C21_009489 [Ambrosia artemisiifolia]
MGVSNSKIEHCEPLRLCKERKKFIKQAIDSRYSLAASHVVYIQSLHNLGIILGKLADTEVLLLDSSAPPSPSHNNNPTLNYMQSVGVSSITVNINPTTINNKVYVEDDIESSPLTMSPSPPPLPPPPRFSWDYFDPTDGSFRFMAHDRLLMTHGVVKHDEHGDHEANGDDSGCESGWIEQCGTNSKDGCVTEETGDHAEVMCNISKGFGCRMKEIESWFVRGSKSGNDVSRMLEVNQIQISYSDVNGGLSRSRSTSSLLTCFRGENSLVLHEPQQTTKLITWKRSMSKNSSLLCLPGPTSTDDNENNFVEEFCMIAGSHSSTLDRLYAWERKLYDEVKASESIRKDYEKKCDELRHQFAKDLKPHLIDKTRAVAKDLHSRMKVALHIVDSISKRIEKMRDEELQPQLMELIQGLMKMWKSMLECHHAQYITSNHSKHSRTRTRSSNPVIMAELEHEVERFMSSFSDLVISYTSYVESINNWLQNCITQPKERGKGRRAFSPRRAVAPPIFIMCRDWSAGIRSLPSQKVSDVMKELLLHIRRLSMEEEMKKKELSLIENGEEKKIEGWDLSMIEGCLTKVFDRLSSYCEESWKMYEDIKDKGETAGNLYLNYRPPPRPSII